MRFFGRDICSAVIALNDKFEEQMILINEINDLKEYTKPKRRK